MITESTCREAVSGDTACPNTPSRICRNPYHGPEPAHKTGAFLWPSPRTTDQDTDMDNESGRTSAHSCDDSRIAAP